MCWFFFFKQKTAYEMHISDWSSDVCSSDLAARAAARRWRLGVARASAPAARSGLRDRGARRGGAAARDDLPRLCRQPVDGGDLYGGGAGVRSDEHTSELQSLIRHSYAVLCSKNKRITSHPSIINSITFLV